MIFFASLHTQGNIRIYLHAVFIKYSITRMRISAVHGVMDSMECSKLRGLILPAFPYKKINRFVVPIIEPLAKGSTFFLYFLRLVCRTFVLWQKCISFGK